MIPMIRRALFLLLLAGCQTAPEYSPATPPASGSLPPAAAAEQAVRYVIVPELSDIRFLVFRAGALARLGHNHVVEAKNIRGEIRLARDIRQSSFFIEMPVKDFQVDAEAARLDEGDEFLPLPDGEAVAGTARNMLGEKVLDAARYPTIAIRSVALHGPDWGMDITLRIGMHGVDRDLVVPTAVERSADRIVATAFFSIRQGDFAIAPMSVLGGALQVDETVKVRMRIVAVKGDSEDRR
jgi:polyisoprenoid-binding protein YceI